MLDTGITPETLLELQESALQLGLSVDALIKQFLSNTHPFLAQNITDMVSRHTPDGTYLYVTPSAHTLLGYHPDELVGKSAYDFFHPEDLVVIQQSHHLIIETPDISTLAYRIRCKDGSYIWFETTSRGVRDTTTNEVIELIAVSRDITKRKQVEHDLHETQIKYRLLFQEAPVAIWKHDFSGAKKYLDALKEAGVVDIETYLLNNVDKLEECLRKIVVLDGNTVALSLYNLSSISHANEAFTQVVVPNDPSKAKALAAIANGEHRFSGEFSNMDANGEAVYILHKWVVMPGHEATYDEVMVVALDITDQKKYQASLIEQEYLIAQFRKEQELNMLIQQSVAAFAHDLRTPLSVIGTSKDLLLNYFDKLTEEKRKEKLESIGRQLEFALELVNDTAITVHSRLNNRSFKPNIVNLNKLCQVSVDEVGQSYKAQNRLRFVNMTKMDKVLVDEILISRMLLNLLSNAIKYSPENTPIRLELDQNDTAIILRVIDEGKGIAPEEIRNIFNPFYRIKGDDDIQGTGLGLSIVKDCVERHGGTIDVISELGKGSTFIITLPMVNKQPTIK